MKPKIIAKETKGFYGQYDYWSIVIKVGRGQVEVDRSNLFQDDAIEKAEELAKLLDGEAMVERL